jgi:hypothetical protein
MYRRVMTAERCSIVFAGCSPRISVRISVIVFGIFLIFLGFSSHISLYYLHNVTTASFHFPFSSLPHSKPCSLGTDSLKKITKKQTTPWSEPVSELYRPSNRRLSAKLVPTFAARECYVVSLTDPYDHNFDFLDRCKILYRRKRQSDYWIVNWR